MLKDWGFQIDNRYIYQGYVIVTLTEPLTKKMKLRVEKNSKILHYTFSNESELIVPLQLGAGEYTFTLYRNVISNKYEYVGCIILNAYTIDNDAYMLSSNCFVKVEDVSSILNKIKRSNDTIEQIKYVRTYLTKNYNYDYIRSVIPPKTEYPDIPYCINHKMGICNDIASMTTAILRALGIKASLMMGTVSNSNSYHAWVSINIDDKSYIFDPTWECIGKKYGKTYKAERWY